MQGKEGEKQLYRELVGLPLSRRKKLIGFEQIELIHQVSFISAITVDIDATIKYNVRMEVLEFITLTGVGFV